jgi:hypothetical protein
VKNAIIGAKKDNITEKSHFPMNFFYETFNYSIPPIIYQQITIVINGMRGNQKWPKNSIHPVQVEYPPKSKNQSHPKLNCHVYPAQRAGYSRSFFLKLSGYHVVSYLSRLEHSKLVLGPFENLTNSVPDPLMIGKHGGATKV